MIYHIYQNEDSIGKAVASMFTAQVLKKKDSVLGFATGSTPIPTYQHMIELYQQGAVDYKDVTTFNLDEYCGLDHSHDQSYYYFMMTNLFNHINVPKERIHIPNGLSTAADEELASYDKEITEAGGVDLQILGLGNNGHIGFNEPDVTFPRMTHKTILTESTIEANTRFFSSSDEVPHFAITMGIGTIMRAKEIVLIAVGKNKAEAVKAMVQGPVDPKCPASILQFHPNATIFLDEEAASLLA